MDDRHLTLIVVPHGDLETRTFAISYRVLRILFGIFVVAFLAFSVFLAFLFPIMAQAARVQGLERELKALEADRARVAELAQTLAEVEEQYEKVRQMLGADAPVDGKPPTLPPLRSKPPASTKEDAPIQQSRGAPGGEHGARDPRVVVSVPRERVEGPDGIRQENKQR